MSIIDAYESDALNDLRDAAIAWAAARAKLNGTKVNTPECSKAFNDLANAEDNLTKATKTAQKYRYEP
jgi:hypothetical protein